MAEYRIIHTTGYRYTSKVSLSHNQLFMVPPDRNGQELISCEYRITPNPTVLHTRDDFFGNKRVYFSVERAHSFLEITVESRVRTIDPAPINQPDYSIEELNARLRELPPGEESLQIEDCLISSPMVPVFPLDAYGAIATLPRTGRDALQFVLELTEYIFNQFSFDAEATTILTPLEQVIREERGVCQDFTHLCISFLRALGIPAAYVSGYLETLPPPGQKRLRGVDATHAWLRAYFPGIGWVDFDPTNGKLRDQRYIETAVSRDYSDAPPLKGVIYGGGKPQMTVAVDVVPQTVAS